MNKTTKWLVGLVAALVVINVALVATIWLKKDEVKRPPQGSDARDYLVQSLHMTDVQIKAFDILRREHFDRIKNYKDALRFTKDKLFALLSNTDRNEIKDTLAKQLTDVIGKLQEKIDKETFEHFSQLRSILTPQQKQKFDTTIQRVLRTMGPRNPQPGDPSRNGMPPPGEGPDGPPPPDGEPPH